MPLAATLLAAAAGGSPGPGPAAVDAASGRLAAGCQSMVATDTDPTMRWFCQGEGQVPVPWRKERDCTNQHIACTPPTAAEGRAGLVVFLPGTGLTPHDYTEMIADIFTNLLSPYAQKSCHEGPRSQKCQKLA